MLVVGTTSDYIDLILEDHPGRALFITSPEIREKAQESKPSNADEIITELDSFEQVKSVLIKHLKHWQQKITGVACFDCESMELASRLASHFDLQYPSLDSVRNCRDKYVSKQLWQENSIPCPSVVPVNTLGDLVQFLSKVKDGIVLKPLYGSGSELVFKCETIEDCEKAFMAIKTGLEKRLTNPLFRKSSSQSHLMLAEEFVTGPEYSCDFIVENNKITIIRLSRKIKPESPYCGTISGYILPADLPERIRYSQLESILLKGANSLGIHRGICMADFIFRDDKIMLIEMTPRPGGDCLPFLLKEAGDVDILNIALDFAEKKPFKLNGYHSFKLHIGLRIHAKKKRCVKKNKYRPFE